MDTEERAGFMSRAVFFARRETRPEIGEGCVPSLPRFPAPRSARPDPRAGLCQGLSRARRGEEEEGRRAGGRTNGEAGRPLSPSKANERARRPLSRAMGLASRPVPPRPHPLPQFLPTHSSYLPQPPPARGATARRDSPTPACGARPPGPRSPAVRLPAGSKAAPRPASGRRPPLPGRPRPGRA